MIGPPQITEVIDAALGRRPLDLVLRGAKVVNVFTRSVREMDIGVLGNRIVLVGKIGAGAITAETEILDCSGRHVVPGFIDPHFHIGGSQLTVPELARALLKRGTTTIVSDLQEIYSYSGMPGVRYILDEQDHSPVRDLGHEDDADAA